MRHKFREQTERHDLYQRATDAIIAQLEKGVKPWTQPWSAGNTEGRIIRPLRHDGKPYAGMNVLTLWVAAQEKGFTGQRWMTFNQAHELGGHVRKGEHHSATVSWADTRHKLEKDEGGVDVEREFYYRKFYQVFNVDQIDGLPDKYYNKPQRLDPVERIERAEDFFASTGADIRTGGGRAFYNQGEDYIRLPPIEAFIDAEHYYGTGLHELAHWTKHPHRLGRDFGLKKFGDEGYAQEELVAELSSAFLAADLDLAPDPKEENAAYIESWLQALKGDKHFIFHAAADARRAADYLISLQPKEPEAAAAPVVTTSAPAGPSL